MRLPIILLFSSILLTILALLTANIFLSTWFLWHLAPESEVKLAFNQDLTTNPAAAKLLKQLNLPDAAAILPLARRIVITKDQSSAFIALLPANPFRPGARSELISRLRSSGWQVSSPGLFITAYQGYETSPSKPPFIAFRRSLLNIFQRKLPWRPSVLARLAANQLPFLSNDTYLAGFINTKTNQFTMTASPSFRPKISASRNKPAYPDNISSEQMDIYLPSDLLGRYLATNTSLWEDMLHKQLRLTKSHPAILKSILPQAEKIRILFSGQGSSLTVFSSNQEFAQLAEQWIQTEEAFSRPTKQGFRLPDKTLGFELVPGKSIPVLSQPDTDGCRAPLQPVMQLWLCQKNNVAALATSKEASLAQTTAGNEYDWHIILGDYYLSRLGLGMFTDMVIYGDDQEALITAGLTKN